jgi:hypothetical protein
MKGLVHVALALAVIGLGFWAYRENYDTQAALREVRGLRADIGTAQARLDRLEAEWAYLNRPDRLRDLAELNFERLELLPLQPEAFGQVADVPLPPSTEPGLLGSAVAVSSDGTAPGEEPL